MERSSRWLREGWGGSDEWASEDINYVDLINNYPKGSYFNRSYQVNRSISIESTDGHAKITADSQITMELPRLPSLPSFPPPNNVRPVAHVKPQPKVSFGRFSRNVSIFFIIWTWKGY